MKTIIEYRCTKCSKLLAKGHWDVATLEIKCNRCGELNSFFDKETDQIVITDENGTILYVNSALLKLTGYSLKEVIGKTPALWGNQMPKKFYEDMWNKIKKRKRVVKVKLINKKKNGRKYEAVLRISPILDVHGEPKFFLGIETKLSQKIKLVKKRQDKQCRSAQAEN